MKLKRAGTTCKKDEQEAEQKGEKDGENVWKNKEQRNSLLSLTLEGEAGFALLRGTEC